MKELYAKSSPPGDDGTSHFNLEIGKMDGTKPTPVDVVFMNVKILEDMIRVNIPEVDPKDFLKRIIDSGYAVERMKEL